MALDGDVDKEARDSEITRDRQVLDNHERAAYAWLEGAYLLGFSPLPPYEAFEKHMESIRATRAA